MPSEQFLRLPPEQQERILQASLVAFAEHGYDLASTNRIVRDAGISKGVLFKYFQDKQALFLHVVEWSTGRYLAGLPRLVDLPIFEWMKVTTQHKLRFLRERPHDYRLALRLAKEPEHPVHALAVRLQTERLRALGPNAPAWDPGGHLRPGVTQEHIWNLLNWIAAGLQEKFVDRLPDVVGERFEEVYQALADEFEVYLGILQFGLYEGEAPS